MVASDRIRNFAIIAHVDHGKSTLADRMIERCGGLDSRSMVNQVLDSMDLERERGITIKAQTVRLTYSLGGVEYVLNLIDTPGHVDFSYEVSRSLGACEGSLLLVDASQGVQAQTLSHAYAAMEHNHELILVLNKMDLSAASYERVVGEVEESLGLCVGSGEQQALKISAKLGQGIEEVLGAIVRRIPSPVGDTSGALCALIIACWYDVYLGVVVLVRVKEGVLRRGMGIVFLSTGAVYTVEKVGVFTPLKTSVESLEAGEIGFFVAGVRAITHAAVGDTVTEEQRRALPAPGFKPSSPVVFCGFFPVDTAKWDALKKALHKLALNDASFSFEPLSSKALGNGFRCGFLGLLHLDIIRTRLDREFHLPLMVTYPTVVYRALFRNQQEKEICSPADFPNPSSVESFYEPWVKVSLILPQDFIGSVMTLCQTRRAKQLKIDYIGERVVMLYELPLSEMVFDFTDELKSKTRGYASLDYKPIGYRKTDLAFVRILMNGVEVDALSVVLHKEKAALEGRRLCAKLKTLIPRQLVQVVLQAACGGKIIARETLKALRKDVTAKCYGGDVTRKQKLLKKQKAGKTKMRSLAKIQLPKDVFWKVMSTDD